jgi:Integral membrane protein CcmA involved in cell shape determination
MTVPAKQGNLRLVGESVMNGGSFGRVSIVGEGKLIGRTECDSFGCTGNSVVEGDLVAKKLRVMGELEVDGDLKSREAKVTGEIKVKGSAQGDSLNVPGGSFSIEGDCEFEEMTVKGMIRAGGLLSADRMELRLFGGSSASEIGGGHILIKQSKAMKLKKMFAAHPNEVIKAGTIEGDVIELENTAADVVRGNRVSIGLGCEIGRVEYRDELKLDRRAKVGEQIRIQ